MVKRFSFFAGLIILLSTVGGAEAGFGIYSLSTKTGLDVVQSNDARHFFVLQSDIATVFSKRMRLEVSGEVGSGTDLDETTIKVVGGGAFLRYMWPNESHTAFAYMGGGLGVNRVRRERVIVNTIEHEMQWNVQFILVGMEKHVMKGRLKALCEVRWILGDEEDATALRVAVGMGVNFGKP